MMIYQRTLRLSVLCALFCSGALLAKPQRIVSLNLCADQLLMELLPAKNLVAVTELAANPEVSHAYKKAQGYHAHSGRVEEIIALQPDLIIAGEFTTTATNQLLESLGFLVIRIGLPQDMEGIFRQISNVAKQVGAEQEAQRLIKSLQQRLKVLAQLKKPSPLPRAVVYYANSYSAGSKTIVNEILNTAGFSNIAAEAGLTGITPFSLERLLSSKADMIILGRFNDNQASLAHQLLQHKAITTFLEVEQVKKVSIPDRLWSCAGPSSIAAAEYLFKSH